MKDKILFLKENLSHIQSNRHEKELILSLSLLVKKGHV